MKFFSINLEQSTQENTYFRQVLNTSAHAQLVVMSLLPKQDIGMEVHHTVDQFIRVEKGNALAILDGEEHTLSDGYAVVIPAGTNHNIINTSETEELKLYTIYSPSNHPEGTVHKTKEGAMIAEEEEHHL